MLYTIAIVLLVLWALGLVSAYTMTISRDSGIVRPKLGRR